MTEALELQTSVSDGDLVCAAADGDRQAFAEIYDRYADRLYDFCVGLIGDRDAAADCVQDAFCVAAKGLGGLREPDKLRPWLYSIARHHAMRRLRHRYREEVSDVLPDMESHEASPETLAGQSELARLVADAAGGLSDRDRELLDLSYRHGLDGPELAEALGVTLTNANTMMFRMRQTVERCLGALLVARAAQTNPDACPELAAILKGWDGQFTVLLRKRMARHIDSCDVCEQDQRRHVNPVALLGGAPVFIPAPDWLRHQTLDRVQLTSASSSMTEPAEPSAMTEPAGPSASSGTTEPHAPAVNAGNGSQKFGKRITLVVTPLLILGLLAFWFTRPSDPVSHVVDTGAESAVGPRPVAPAATKSPPQPGRPQSLTPAGPDRPTVVPDRPGQTAPGAATTAENPGGSAPAQTPGGSATGPAPDAVLPNPGPAAAPDPGPTAAPAPPPIHSAPVPDWDPKVAQSNGSVDTAADPAPQVTAADPPVDVAPVPAPKVTTAGPQGNTATFPNPNLNPKIVSSYPQTNTATVTNPQATTPDLQIGGAPKLNTNPVTAPKPNTNTTSGTSSGTSSGTNTNSSTNGTNTNSSTNTKNSTNTNTKTSSGTGTGTNTNSNSKGTSTK